MCKFVSYFVYVFFFLRLLFLETIFCCTPRRRCRWTPRIFAERIVRIEFSTRLLFVSPGRVPKRNKRIYYSFRCLRRKHVSVDCSPWICLTLWRPHFSETEYITHVYVTSAVKVLRSPPSSFSFLSRPISISTKRLFCSTLHKTKYHLHILFSNEMHIRGEISGAYYVLFDLTFRQSEV